MREFPPLSSNGAARRFRLKIPWCFRNHIQSCLTLDTHGLKLNREYKGSKRLENNQHSRVVSGRSELTWGEIKRERENEIEIERAGSVDKSAQSASFSAHFFLLAWFFLAGALEKKITLRWRHRQRIKIPSEKDDTCGSQQRMVPLQAGLLARLRHSQSVDCYLKSFHKSIGSEALKIGDVVLSALKPFGTPVVPPERREERRLFSFDSAA